MDPTTKKKQIELDLPKVGEHVAARLIELCSKKIEEFPTLESTAVEELSKTVQEKIGSYFEIEGQWKEKKGESFLFLSDRYAHSCECDISSIFPEVKFDNANGVIPYFAIAVTPEGDVLVNDANYRGEWNLECEADRGAAKLVVSSISELPNNATKIPEIAAEIEKRGFDSIPAAQEALDHGDQQVVEHDGEFMVCSKSVLKFSVPSDTIVVTDLMKPLLLKPDADYVLEQSVTGKHIRLKEGVEFVTADESNDLSYKTSTGLLDLIRN